MSCSVTIVSIPINFGKNNPAARPTSPNNVAIKIPFDTVLYA